MGPGGCLVGLVAAKAVADWVIIVIASLMSLAALYQLIFYRKLYQPRNPIHAKFLDEVVAVGIHSAGADKKLGADPGAGKSLSNQAQDLDFALGELPEQCVVGVLRGF